jgi:hypothetical protein
MTRSVSRATALADDAFSVRQALESEYRQVKVRVGVIGTPKSGKPREIPLGDDVKAALEARVIYVVRSCSARWTARC